MQQRSLRGALSYLVRGCAFFGLLWLAMMGLNSFFLREHTSAYRSACQSNMKQLAIGLQQYVQDYDGRMPLASIDSARGWTTEVQPYVKTWGIYHCPQETNRVEPNSTYYWYNRRVSPRPLKTITNPSNTILLGEGEQSNDPGISYSTFPAGWASDSTSPLYRHWGMSNYVFVDGHVKSLKVQNVREAGNHHAQYSFAP